MTKPRINRHFFVLGTVLMIGALGGCSDTSDNPLPGGAGLPQADNPVVEGPVTGGGGEDCCLVTIFGFSLDTRDLGYEPGTAFYGRALSYPEEEVGYQEREYFISGDANRV